MRMIDGDALIERFLDEAFYFQSEYEDYGEDESLGKAKAFRRAATMVVEQIENPDAYKHMGGYMTMKCRECQEFDCYGCEAKND